MCSSPFRLADCGLTERCCDDLASVISSNSSSLTHLDLSANELLDPGVQRLCDGLKSPHCKLVDLRSVHLKFVTVLSFSSSLSVSLPGVFSLACKSVLQIGPVKLTDITFTCVHLHSGW